MSREDSGDDFDDGLSDFEDSPCFVSEYEFQESSVGDDYDEEGISYQIGESSRQSFEGQDQEDDENGLEEEDEEDDEISNDRNEDEDSNHDTISDSEEESDPYTSDEEDEVTGVRKKTTKPRVGDTSNNKSKAFKGRFAFPCDQCDKGYYSLGDLKGHIHRFHNPMTAKVEAGKDYTKNVYEENCSKCHKVFYDPIENRTHHSCYAFPQRIKVKGRNKFKCPEPGCKVNTEPNIQRFGEHLCRTHYKETDFNFLCSYCPKTFWEEGSAVLHVVNYHLDNYDCEECGQKFPTGVTLSVHKTKKHNRGYRPDEDTSLENIAYIKHKFCKRCKDCDRIFTHPPIFRTHDPCFSRTKYFLTDPDSVASGLRYQCHLCDMKFSKIYVLAIHVSGVHIKDFRYECKYCGKRVIDRRTIAEHLARKHGIVSRKDISMSEDFCSGKNNQAKKPVGEEGKSLSSTPVSLKPTSIRKHRIHPGIKEPELKKQPEANEASTSTPMQMPIEMFNIKCPKTEVPKTLKINLLPKRNSTEMPEEAAEKHAVDVMTPSVSHQKQPGQSSVQLEREVKVFDIVPQDPRIKPRLPPAQSKSSDSPAITPFDSSSNGSLSSVSATLTERPTDPRLRRQESASSLPTTQMNLPRITSSDNPFYRRRQETVDWNKMVLERTSVTAQVSGPVTTIGTQNRNQPLLLSGPGDHRRTALTSTVDIQQNMKEVKVNDDWVITRINDTHSKSSSSNCHSFIKERSFFDRCERCQEVFNDALNFYVHDPCYGTYPASRGLRTTCPPFICSFTGCTFKTNYLKELQHHMMIHFKYKGYRCSICDEDFYLPEDGEKHYNRRHRLDSSSTMTLAVNSFSDIQQHFKLRDFYRYCSKCSVLFTEHLKFLVHDPCYSACPGSRGRRTTDTLLCCTVWSCDFKTKDLNVLQNHANDLHFKFAAYSCIHCPATTFLNISQCREHYDQRHARLNTDSNGFEWKAVDEWVPNEGQRSSPADVKPRNIEHKPMKIETLGSKPRDRSPDKRSRSPRGSRRSPSHSRRSREKSVDRKRRKSRSPTSRHDSHRRHRSRSRERKSSHSHSSRSSRDNREKRRRSRSPSNTVCCIELPKKEPCLRCNERHSFPTSVRTHYPCFMYTENYIYDKETCERRFRCGVCQKDYKSLEDLGVHESTDHYWMEDVAFQCSICFRKFFTDKKVMTHMRSSHPKQCSKGDIEVVPLDQYTQRQFKLKQEK